MIIEVLINLLFATLEILPIYLIAALGAYLSQRVGVFDISVEGNMTLGCSLGIIGYYFTNSAWMGLLFGLIGGVIIGIVLSSMCVSLKLDQIIIGFGLWFFGLGISSFFYKLYIPFDLSTEGFSKISDLIGIQRELRGLLRVLELDIIFFISIMLLVSISFVLYRTKTGVIVRATGENPVVVDAAGVNITLLRYINIIIGTALIGTAGAYLAVDFLQGYTKGMVAGRGWIAFIIVIFGRWKPMGIFWGCLLFAGINGLQIRLQVIGIRLPSELLTAFPYIATIIGLAAIMSKTGKSKMPTSLGVPYFRE